jgi:dTDP-4-amino-4,6-dideoxygalactose transaminase
MNCCLKNELGELSLLGGEPAFSEKLHVGRPNVGDRDKLLARINDLLDRRWLTNHGPYVEEFEQRVADYLGVEHFVAMCNGTVALEIAIRALNLKGEVIVPSFTFIATAHALQWQEITPIFCDIDPQTHTISASVLERMITPRTTGIIGVHIWGQPCDTEALSDIASRRRLALLYDASPAFGCSHGGKMIGNFGELEVFSFHATKFLNTFEGGGIATNDGDLARRIRLMKNFGFSGFDNVIYLGTNGKMPEVSAAMGLTGLEGIENTLAGNRRTHELYDSELGDVPGIRLIHYDGRERCNYQYAVLELEEELTGLSRDALIAVLNAENVVARRYFYPGCHRMEPYRSLFPHAGLLLPETEMVASRIVVLPAGAVLSEEEVVAVARLVRLAVQNGRELTGRLARREARAPSPKAQLA